MSDSYIGEVRLVGFNFAPVGWALCNGQLLAISQYEALYTLIGTTYGGDGVNTFGLPNLQSRVPVHQGSNGGQAYVMGQLSGSESVTISSNTYPVHTHALLESVAHGTPVADPTNNTVAGGLSLYTNLAPTTAMAGSMITTAQGGSQPHSNIQPYLAMNWAISLFGIFPSQN